MLRRNMRFSVRSIPYPFLFDMPNAATIVRSAVGDHITGPGDG